MTQSASNANLQKKLNLNEKSEFESNYPLDKSQTISFTAMGQIKNDNSYDFENKTKKRTRPVTAHNKPTSSK